MANTQIVKMEMMRGDTFTFDVALNDIDPSSIRSLYFTVKRKATDSDAEAVVQKSLTDGITRIEGDDLRYRVRVAPADTDGVPARTYAYDIQIGIEEDIYTFVKGTITINQDVTEAMV